MPHVRKRREETVLKGCQLGLSLLRVIDRDFVYATAQGDNTFTVKAVDRAGNTSEASNPYTVFLWPC